MSSVQAKAVSLLLRLTRKKSMATVAAAAVRIAAPKADPAPAARITRSCEVSVRDVKGFRCYTVAPRASVASAAVLYLHGGAYISEITPQHWSFVARLVRRLGCRVEVPIYGLAPQHCYREAYPMMRELYGELIAGYGPGKVAIAGDSAGGGLALGAVMSLPDWSLPPPASVLLLSPWLDLTMSNPDSIGVERTDPWLSRTGLIEAGQCWADGDDPTIAQLSPLNGPMSGLPPIEVYVGTHDVFWPDTRRLRDLAGATVTLHETPGLFHVFPLVPFVPEARTARNRALTDLAEALADDSRR